MCGIAGIVNHEGIDLDGVMRSLRHRGPDDQQIYTYGEIALIHTRLAIVDIERAVQPMHHAQYSIIFNGEIYNHLSLRERFSKDAFHTTSDTETLLHLYEKYGPGMLDLIDGMFAFAILDRTNRTLFMARDRAGKKPLYYCTKNGRFIFASEINAILKAVVLEIDDEAVDCYIKSGLFHRRSTPFQGLHELENGEYLKLNTTDLGMTTHRYFDILDVYRAPKLNTNFNGAMSEVEKRLTKSVDDRLKNSDLEVGAFLSGGIDSSLVVAIASKLRPGLRTFTVSFDGSYDESEAASLVASACDTDHTEIRVEMNVRDDIEKIVQNHGEPIMDNSVIPSFYVSKAAREHVTVILNGDGADELFGGYRRYVPFANGLIGFFKRASFLKDLLPVPSDKMSWYNYLYRLVDLASCQDEYRRYLSATNDLFIDGMYETEGLGELASTIESIANDTRLSDLDKILYLDFDLLLFSVLLLKMDIATMASSLEGRSPFLSTRMLEYAPRLSDDFKIRGFRTKYILRKLAARHVPPSIPWRAKKGFEVPLQKWVEDDLKDMVHDALSGDCYAYTFVKKDSVRALIDGNLQISREQRAKILWTLFCLELWHRGIR